MIGRPEWFTTRRYTGIGLRPKTWQGWVYIAVAIVLVIFIRWQSFWGWSMQTRNILTIAWAVVLVLDAIHIIYVLNKGKQGSGS
jgi:hypothetical protein